MKSPIDISVLICTLDRAESLRVTLECLATANRDGLSAEVVVIDNGGKDHTRAVVDSFAGRLRVRYLRESKPGRGNCLNHAFETGGLGEIVAVLDDDMSPEPGWFQGVAAICQRWPDKDVFSGRSYIIWPGEQVPPWASRKKIRSWAFSISDPGGRDKVLTDGKWPSTNHFWFRSRVLAGGRRVEVAPTKESRFIAEVKFILDLLEAGYGLVVCPDAATGHRVQPALLEEQCILERAELVGRSFAEVRLRPHRTCIKPAVHFKRHPVLARLFCVSNLCLWQAAYHLERLGVLGGDRFDSKAEALFRQTYYRGMLKIAGEVDDYKPGFFK